MRVQRLKSWIAGIKRGVAGRGPEAWSAARVAEGRVRESKGNRATMSRKRLAHLPEIPLAVTAFFLNFFWEMVQSPFYDDINRKTYVEILVSRLHCTLGDVLIILGSYWIVAWLVRNRYWVLDLRIRNVVGFTLLGLGYTIVSEWINVDIRGAWGYGAAMPRVPWIGTGVAPFVQWMFLPPLIAGVTCRLVGSSSISR